VRRLRATLALLTLSCAGVPLAREGLTDPGALLFNGYTRADVDCYACHNGDGRGARGPALIFKVPRLSEDKIARTIRNGKGMMPKYGEKLSDDEVAQVVSWLKATFR
jgi:mono/diheme cytochrome c family protein